VVAFEIGAALLAGAALVQSVRIGVRRHDWIALKLLFGLAGGAALIYAVMSRLTLGR
jgi:hypothetical protein